VYVWGVYVCVGGCMCVWVGVWVWLGVWVCGCVGVTFAQSIKSTKIKKVFDVLAAIYPCQI